MLLTSLLDNFGTCSLCVVCADNAVETVLDAQLASSIMCWEFCNLPCPCWTREWACVRQ